MGKRQLNKRETILLITAILQLVDAGFKLIDHFIN